MKAFKIQEKCLISFLVYCIISWCNDSPEEDPLLRIIRKYKNHSSIKFIKSKNKSQTFKFRVTNIDEIKKYIDNLNPKKASQKSDMNTNIIRKNAAFFCKIYVWWY